MKFFMSLRHISLNNSKNTKHTHVSPTGTDHRNTKLSKIIQFEKDICSFFSIFEKIYKKVKSKSSLGRIAGIL